MSRTNKNTYKEQIKYNEKDWIQANHDTSATHAKIWTHAIYATHAKIWLMPPRNPRTHGTHSTHTTHANLVIWQTL